MATAQDKIRHIKAADRENNSRKSVVSEENCARIHLDELRAYLMERRRAVITELEALNQLLKIE